MKTRITTSTSEQRTNILFGCTLIAFLSSAILCAVSAFAQPCQCGAGRYLQPIFGRAVLGTNVQYTQNASLNFDGTTEQETMDIWGPAGDNCDKRPVIIWVHGGGFAQQDKTAPDMVAMCDSFSRRGFVVASIDYRDDYWGTTGAVNDNSQNPTPYDTKEFNRADFRAMQDAKCAVRFFKANAATYGVDTNNIFMGGTSAGGWTSYMVAYMNKASEKPADCGVLSSVAGIYSRPDLGTVDGNGGWNNVSSRVRGIIPCWGAILDTAIVDGPNDPAAIMFHETNDPVVNFNYGAPFQGQYQNFNSYWGSYYINQQMNNVGVTHKFFPINGNQHSLYPYRGMVTVEVSKFLDSLICTSTATAINEVPTDNSFSVYPNPSNGIFQLSTFNFGSSTLNLQVYNSIGEQVLSETANQKSTIDLSGCPSGVYFIKVIPITTGNVNGILTEMVVLSR